ncbi:hypothetical protein OAF54_01740 [bacterium]|nr:hypothetical protein [bacterium]
MKRTAVDKVLFLLDDKYTNIGQIAEDIGLHSSAGFRWRRECGGQIPTRDWNDIIALAKKHKVKLQKTDLIND